MKDLEKIAPKQKGIVPQSVKEITQLLVDEGLVECEKIGTFVCYWAFPSQAGIIVRFFSFPSSLSNIAEVFSPQMFGFMISFATEILL